ncbi:hypothetical protein, partial [Anaerotruncus massiliensis (ex Togo et al. 2019)]|uniref:hypothetical protein n=1 Tax=Anaerotruncus massiliensis (ex Togo et al. 2019) TaxID=1673720 RepID=UPI0023F07F92
SRVARLRRAVFRPPGPAFFSLAKESGKENAPEGQGVPPAAAGGSGLRPENPPPFEKRRAKTFLYGGRNGFHGTRVGRSDTPRLNPKF